MKEDTISFVDSFDLASELAACAMSVIKSYDSNLHGKFQESFAAIIANQSNTDKDVYCCICFKTGLSTVEDDGGTECQLSDGRWVCSRECYEEALLSLMIKESEVDLDSEPDNQLNQRNGVTKKTCALDRALRAEAGLIAYDGADDYGTDGPIAAAREMIADAINFACAANHHLAGQDPEQAQQWRDALATLADALDAERTRAEQRKEGNV